MLQIDDETRLIVKTTFMLRKQGKSTAIINPKWQKITRAHKVQNFRNPELTRENHGSLQVAVAEAPSSASSCSDGWNQQKTLQCLDLLKF